MQAVRLWIERGSLQLAEVEWTAWQTVQPQLLRSLDESTLTDAQQGDCGRLLRFEENSFSRAWRGECQVWSPITSAFITSHPEWRN